MTGLRLEQHGNAGVLTLSAAAKGNNTLVATFSSALDPGPATNASNYSLTNSAGPVAVTAATLGSDQRTVTLTTASQAPYNLHTLLASNIRAQGGSQTLSASTTYTNIPFTAGYIRRELFLNITNSSVSTLTNSPNFPNNPDQVTYLTSAGWPAANIYNQYGGRLWGWVAPPITGNYYIAANADDNLQLFFSQDDDPSHKTMVAYSTSCCQGYDAQSAGPFYLVAGQKYYLEALMKEATGGDYLYVAWKSPTNGTWTQIPGDYLGNFLAPAGATVSIQQSPANTATTDGQAATFRVWASGSSSVSGVVTYQWQRNGIDIPGASLSAYTTPPLAIGDSGTAYRVLVGVPGAAQFSSSATLTVTPDTVRPTVTGAYNLGTTNLYVVFSEAVQAATATNHTNYVFLAGATVQKAALFANNTVILTTSPMIYGTNYSVRINNVRDLASPPNLILTNTLVSFTPRPFLLAQVGTPGAVSVNYVAGGFDATSSGTSVGGTSDQTALNYTPRTGDFDVCARLSSLELSHIWAKAGIMARESTESGARYAAALATPAMAGTFFSWRSAAWGLASSSGSFPPNFPYQWLRLKRTGDVFTGYAGYDGVQWSQLGSVTMALPAQLLVGTVFSSQSTASSTVQVRDFFDCTNTLVSAVVNPYEPPGPGSRSTPLAITEIMYKPAPRTDLRNLEFVEVYNSYPFPCDLSRFRIQGNNLDYTFPANTVIPGGGYRVIAAAPADVEAVYGITGVLGPYLGSLKADDTLELYDEREGLLFEVPYSDQPPWPVGADGGGHSLALKRPTYGLADPRAWAISDRVGGSPGQFDSFSPAALRNVCINEILAHTDLPDFDYVELYNHSASAVNISGCILTDDPDTNRFIVPMGTSIPARGFVYFRHDQMGFALGAAGETVWLFDPAKTRALDVVRFEAQENGVGLGRSPDGASEFYRLAAKTPGTNNAALLKSPVVINEIMYRPLSGNEDEEYVELYNRSGAPIDLSGWKLKDAVSYTIPTNTVVGAQGYLVIARSVATLLSNYPNLNVFNCVGNFSGQLSGKGERLALTKPDWLVSTNSDGVIETNLIHIRVNEVSWKTGGRWGQWADGGGSSLELIDPETNTRLAANWADSIETGKSSWATVEHTGVLNHGQNISSSIGYAQIGILDRGECLVDNLQVISSAGTNCVLNGGFESGLSSWSLQGCHSSSTLTSPGDASSAALHIRATDQMFTGLNSCQVALGANGLASGQTATLRFRARWLRGHPEPLMRLNGNWLEATGRLPVPRNLGTPGQINSTFVANAGPACYEVTHSPALPAVSQEVIVTLRAHDPNGVKTLTLNYRIDPSSTTTTTAFRDDGQSGDLLAADGIYSARIPGQARNALVAFWVTASDTPGKTTRFPAAGLTNLPPRECLVLFGTTNSAGSFGSFHMWISATNAARWTALLDLSNESHDVTIVNGNRVVYNAAGRFGGSPYHQGFTSPTGPLCHYKWTFPDDEPMLGETSFNKVHQPGNGAGDDASLQREQLANTLLRHLGVPWLNRRYINVFVNGARRGTLMEDVQRPDGDLIKQNWPGDDNGWLYKLQPWFEFQGIPGSSSISFQNCSWCNFMPYTTTGGAKKVARYRYNFLARRTPVSMSDYTNVFSLIDAASSSTRPDYVAQMENLADMENWMRMFAANHAAGNWDSVGAQNSQNVYGYLGSKGTRFSLLMWDFNIVFGNSGSWGPGANLFSVNSQDPNMSAIYNNSTFRRMYWRALEELVNGPLNTTVSGPMLDAKYAEFAANGFSVENPSSIKSWLSQARGSIASQLASVNPGSFAISTSVPISNNIAYLTGMAPVKVKAVAVNGVTWPITWTSVGGWRLAVPLVPGSNALSITGVDMGGNPISGMSNFLAVSYAGSVEVPARDLVISEIMFDPSRPNTSFVELHNRGTNTHDLSEWEFRGLSLVFAPGSMIQPGQYLVLTENRAAFSALYGASNVAYATYSGALQNNGETLSLIRAGTNDENDRIVTRVRYSPLPPWPAGATNTGRSLQLRDVAEDNWRVANWAVSGGADAATPGRANSVATNLAPFPSLWLNELQVRNLTGPSNRFGQRTAWVELHNPGVTTVFLEGLYLSTNATSLAAWPFPAGATIDPGQFKVIWADAATNLTTSSEWHASFTLPPSGMVLLSRAQGAEMQTLDYLDYPEFGSDHSYGSAPDGQSFTRQEFFFVTAGLNNNPASPSIRVFINEWMADNDSGIADPADNDYEDWFELYNPSTDTVDLGGYYLTDNLTNKFQSEIPNNHHYLIPPGGYLLVWADGERGQNSTNRADLHVNFKLSNTGDTIALYAPDGTPVDLVTFGPQSLNISEGLVPNGSYTRWFFTNATPGTPNSVPNNPPILAPLPSLWVTSGMTLSVQASASDPDSPPQTLLYSLTSAPNGASINPATGTIHWQPVMAPVISLFSVTVVDDGLPSLSDTRVFSVYTVPQPALENVSMTGNQLVFRWQTVPGQSYQLEYKESLASPQWLPSGSPIPGDGNMLSITNSVGDGPCYFYRLNLVP